MRQKTTPSNSVSSVAAPSTPRNDRESSRSRRGTDPLSSSRLGGTSAAAAERAGAAGLSNRHSIDSASRLAACTTTTTKSSSLSNIFHSNSSPISSENFSDPVLASFSPRKPRTVTSSSCSSSRGPTLKLRTPQPAARDHGSPSPSTTTTTTTTATNNTTTTTDADTVTTHNFSTSPTAPPSVAQSHSATTPKAASSLEPKSPPSSQKRSPASRSSHGIETSSGPPPALSTRHSQQTRDKSWSAVANHHDDSSATPSAGPAMAVEPARQPPRTSSGVEGNNNRNHNNNSSSNNHNMKAESPPPATTLPARKQRASFPTRSYLQSRDRGPMSPTLPRFNGSLRTVSDRTERDESGGADTTSKELIGDDTKKNDDIFLNIAKDTSDQRTPTNRTERHRTNGSLHQISRLRQSRSSPSPAHEYDANRSEVSQQADYPAALPGSSTVRSPSTARPLDETNRLRYFGVTPRTAGAHTRSRLSRANPEISSDPPQNYSEPRGSTQDPSQMRSYRQSYLAGTRSSRALSGTDGTERAKPEADRGRFDGTESTLSTNAPSTVWDELDDLKSRMRKLEVTGKFPTSSAAAMSSFSGERPRTATTTVTTLSSSPKQARKASSPPPPPPPESESTPVTNQIQNLLLTALAKSKPRLSSPVYKALEATATDALTLSNMLSSNAVSGSGATSLVNGNGTVNSERQMRRKADSVCRSLTEVCLALSEGQAPPSSSSSTKPRPGSRDTSTVHPRSGSVEPESTTTPNFSYRRSGSHEPEDLHRRQNSFNVSASNGLREDRRSSMYNLSNGNYGSDDVPDSPSAVNLPTPPARFSRSSHYLRSRRLQGNEQYDDNESTVSRPLSRAMTDAAPPGPRDRFSTRDRISHTNSSPYTPSFDNHQPVHEDRSPRQYAGHSRASSTVQSGLPLRRSYASQSHIPAASHTSIRPGFRRYAATNGGGMRESLDHSSTSKGSDAVNSFQDDGRSRALDPARSASHRSSLQHLRNRTNSNSIGSRRISITPRHVPVPTNGGGMGHDNID